jgi:hypothetical protein
LRSLTPIKLTQENTPDVIGTTPSNPERFLTIFEKYFLVDGSSNTLCADY